MERLIDFIIETVSKYGWLIEATYIVMTILFLVVFITAFAFIIRTWREIGGQRRRHR